MTVHADDSGVEDEDTRIYCKSLLWIYSGDPREFEARRAIANLARPGLVADPGDDPSTSELFQSYMHALPTSDLSRPSEPADVLPHIKACNDLSDATAKVLRSLVDEARRQGVSWAAIGGALGIGATAAQKRFRDREGPSEFIDQIKWDAALFMVAACQAPDSDSDEMLSENDRGLPPEWFFRSAVVELHWVAKEFHFAIVSEVRETMDRHGQTFEMMPLQWWDKLEDARSRLHKGLRHLVLPSTIGKMSESGKYWPKRTPYTDLNPALYFSYACYQGLLARGYLGLLDKVSAVEDPRLYGNIIMLADTHLRFMVEALARPECVMLDPYSEDADPRND